MVTYRVDLQVNDTAEWRPQTRTGTARRALEIARTYEARGFRARVVKEAGSGPKETVLPRERGV